MPESLRTRLRRYALNLFPAFWATGGRLVYISHDWREVRLRIPLSWRTRNYVGTMFGGSMYGATDGIHMVMLIHALGPGYVVWDKAATIRFKKPGRSTLYARFLLNDSDIDQLRETLAHQPSTERIFAVDLTGADGVVHATVERTIYVRGPSDAPASSRNPAPPSGSGGDQ